jgi:pilus assembly protein Flp/PilA
MSHQLRLNRFFSGHKEQSKAKIPKPVCLVTQMPTFPPARSFAPELEAPNQKKPRRNLMTTFALNALARLHNDEAGQGLVEYLLILALVAFAATAGMSTMASSLNSAFSQIGVVLAAYIT